MYNRNHNGKEVSWSDRLEFLNGWYLMIIFSDILTIIGSILKIEIQTKVIKSWYIIRAKLTYINSQSLGPSVRYKDRIAHFLSGTDELRCVQHLPWYRHHVRLDRCHPLYGLL